MAASKTEQDDVSGIAIGESDSTDLQGHPDSASHKKIYNLYCPKRNRLNIVYKNAILYHLAIYDLGRDKPDLILPNGADTKGQRLACSKLQRSSKDFHVYLGVDETPAEEDWSTVRCISGGSASGSSRMSHFSAPSGTAEKRSFHWTKTREQALGASRWIGRDYKLLDEDTGAVLAVYFDRVGIHAVGRRGRIAWTRECDETFEIQALIVLFSILERKSRGMQSLAKALSGGGGSAGVMAA